MDGYPTPKSKSYGGQQYSDTRFAVIKWLEQQLPGVSGRVLNVSAGGWSVPRQLLNNSKITQYTTYDLARYGDAKNQVDVVGDVHSMPASWTDTWDCVINNQAIECYENPFKAMSELHRVLKPGGVLLIDAPFNYVWFGRGSNPESLKKKNPVKDYWRITEDGWRLLTKQFSTVDVQGFGGTVNSRYVYCVRAVK
jgi:SAM-dependent methyltransferase